MSTFFNFVGNNDISSFFKRYSKIFASESKPNDLSIFFDSGGNNDILSYFNLIQRYFRKLHQKVNQMICQLFSFLVGILIFYLFLTSFKDICENCITQLFSTPVGTMIFCLFLTSFKDICEICNHKLKQNNLSSFFNSSGNNDIYPILTSFKEICESCIRK